MNVAKEKKDWLYLIPYCIPFGNMLFYADAYVRQNKIDMGEMGSAFFTIALFIVIPIVYIGMGVLCSRKRLLRICVFGTILHCILFSSLLYGTVKIFWSQGEIEAWFPLLAAGASVGIFVSQLIGYGGAKI